MENNETNWGALALIACFALLLAALLLPPLPKAKARALRIQGVNTIPSAFVTTPSTNAPPTATTNK
jgi:hypothetical protein